MHKKLRSSLVWFLSCTTLFVSMPFEALYAAPESAETVQDNEILPDTMWMHVEEELQSDIIEIAERRNETVKHFLREDGLFSVVSYDVPVHYMDLSGEWLDIDNRLVLSGDGSSYTSTNGQVTKTFAADRRDGFLFSETYKDNSISIYIDNDMQNGQKANTSVPAEILKMHDETGMSAFDAASTPDYLSQTILYSQIYDNVDYSYESYSNNIKENIVIAKPLEDYSYSFIVDSGELTAKQDEEGNIRFYTPSGEEIFCITAPYMTDAEGCSSDAVTYLLEEILWEKEAEPSVDLEDILTEESAWEAFPEEDVAEESEPEETVGIENEPEEIVSDENEPEEMSSDEMEAEGQGESFFDTENDTPVNTANTKEHPRYRLTLKADASWLNDPERAFPVIIDPSLEVSSGTSSADITSTYVVEGTPTTKQSNYQSLYVGYGVNSKVKRQPIFLHVNNLPSLPDNCLPVAAYLGYYQPSTNGWSAVGISALTLECHELTPSTTPSDYVSWIRNLTWNTKPSYSATVLDYATITNATRTTYSSWNITEAVKKWYENSSTNKGLALIPREDSFSSTRGAVAVLNGWGSSYPSRMVVNYRNMVGVEDCYTYETAGIDDAGVCYISDYTNNLTLAREDISFPSVCQEYSLSHVYNSANHGTQYTVNESAGLHVKNCDSMKTGLGWKLSCQQTIIGLTVSSDLHLIWNDGDGTEHYFKRTAADPSYFYDEDGLGLTIHRTYPNNGNDVLYTMTDQDKYHTWEFYNGYLSAIRDSNGNAVYIAYNNNYSASSSSWRPVLTTTTNIIKQIVSVADGQSPVTLATFTYSGGYLQTITDFRGNITQYTYTSGRLTGITKADGQTISYSYNSRGYLSAAEDQETKYGMRFDYVSHGTAGADTVSRFWEYAKNGSTQLAGNAYDIRKETTQYGCLRYEGADHATTNTLSGTGADDILQYMSFDHQGRTINVTQKDAAGKILGVEAASYTRNSGISKANNKLTSVAASGMEGVNLL